MDDILPAHNFSPDLFVRLSEQPESNISKLSSNRAEQIGYYRLLENKKFTESSLIEELIGRVKPLVAGRDVLCIEGQQ